ncbi:MAG: phosphatidate cytidylyltransferase [Nitrospirae bacterium]|nr:MAG: phosphatidate cytidylyltransferase [Nitrospirota bacterium]
MLVALIAVPLLYLYVTKLPAPFFLILLMVVSTLALHEFFRMFRVPARLSALGLVCGLMLFAPHILNIEHPLNVQALAGAAAFMMLATVRLFLVKDPMRSFADLAPIAFGLLYIPSLLIPQWLLRLQGIEWIFMLYLSVWMSDTLAYYIGKNFGTRKLYPEMSPKKTVEGGLGSLLGGTAVGLVFGFFVMPSWGPVTLGLFGMFIGGITIIGDLVESMFKRDAGVKDSGTLIPGHGGVLDRFDSVLFAGPALYFMKQAFA